MPPPSRVHFALLSELNEDVEGGRPLPVETQRLLWHDWLWGCAPDETLLEECGGMNGMHLRGLLLARSLANERPAAPAGAGAGEGDDVAAGGGAAAAATGGGCDGGAEGVEQPDGAITVGDLFPDCDDVQVHESAVGAYTARELRDTVEACQLHTQRLLALQGAAELRAALLHLMMRFGELAGGAYDERVMDDAASVTRIPTDDPGETLFILSCKALRTFVNVFLMLFRCVEIHAMALSVRVCERDNAAVLMAGGAEPEVCERYARMVHNMIKPFHVEASLDEFNALQQMWFLAPGHRLVYRHNFAGMFNDISQVVYFHYPSYVRSAQVTVAEMGEHALNALPCLLNIVPQIKVLHDDDAGLPFGGGRGLGEQQEWAWVMSAKRMYLWDGMRGRLLRSAGTGVLDLAAYYLLCVHGLDFFGGGGDGGGGTAAAAEQEDRVQRVKMTDFGHARIVGRRRPAAP